MTTFDGIPVSRAGPRLTVVNGNWGATSLAEVQAVLGSACDALTEAFGTPPDDAIHVARWDQDPRVFDDHRPYEIRLNARDRFWFRYVYQFSHELCHVMTGFDRCKDHKHKWFEETLCELASLFVLHRLAVVWKETPPPGIAGARDFAVHHETYSVGIETGYRNVVHRPFPQWFAGNVTRMEANRYERHLNGVVAVALLDRFRKEPSLWRDCRWLNQWNARKDATFADYLDSWAACLAHNGRPARAPAVVSVLLQPRPARAPAGP